MQSIGRNEALHGDGKMLSVEPPIPSAPVKLGGPCSGTGKDLRVWDRRFRMFGFGFGVQGFRVSALLLWLQEVLLRN